MREVIGKEIWENGEEAVYILDTRTGLVDCYTISPAREKWFMPSRTYEKLSRYKQRAQVEIAL